MQLAVQDNNRSLLVGSIPFPFLRSRGKKGLEQVVVDRILVDDDFLEMAVAAIYSMQTPEEQRRGRTIFRNQRGFDASDVHVFSAMAERVLNGEGLSERDLAICRALLPSGIPWLGKYRTQLASIFQNELLPDTGDNNDSLPGGVEKGAVQ